LDFVELAMELEEEFGVTISVDKAEEIRTVDDAIRYIIAYRSETA
jgi:acyl carrier protein